MLGELIQIATSEGHPDRRSSLTEGERHFYDAVRSGASTDAHVSGADVSFVFIFSSDRLAGCLKTAHKTPTNCQHFAASFFLHMTFSPVYLRQNPHDALQLSHIYTVLMNCP